MRDFKVNLQTGLLGEGEIAKYFISRGWMVLPAYQIEMDTGKGPRLFTCKAQLITPDMLIFNSNKVMWIEAKTKTSFTWYRIGNCWQDGIDKRHWLDYCRVADETPWPVWLLFLHRPGEAAKNTPDGMVPPVGLFGQDITHLRSCIDHESDRWANGMVYWNLGSLKQISEYPLRLKKVA